MDDKKNLQKKHQQNLVSDGISLIFLHLVNFPGHSHDVVPQRLVRDLLSWGMIRERFNWAMWWWS